MRVLDLYKHYPDAVITIKGADGNAYDINSAVPAEGIYDRDNDEWILLSENNLTDLEMRYSDGDGLDFVSLVVVEACCAKILRNDYLKHSCDDLLYFCRNPSFQFSKWLGLVSAGRFVYYSHI